MQTEGRPPPSDGRIVARAAAVNALGMLAKSSRALATIFITRVGGAAVFGLFMAAASVAELTTRFTIFGLDKSVMKYVPEGRTEDPAGEGTTEYPVLSTAVYTGAFLSLLATAFLLLAAPWVATTHLEAPEAATPIRIVAFAVFPLTMSTLLLAATKALKIMRYEALVAGLVTPLVLLVLAIPILWTENDVTTLAFAYTMSTVAAFALSVWFFRRHFDTSRLLRTSPSPVVREVLWFSTPLGLHDFVQSLATKLELFLILLFVGPTQLGIYALASEISFVMKKIRQSFDPIMIPLMSEASAMGETDRAQEQVTRVVRWLFMICVPFVGTMILLGGPILSLFGPEYAAGALTLALLCGAQLLNVLTGLFDLSMMVSGRPRINLFNVSTLVLVQTVLNLWLIPEFGIVGAALAALGAFSVLALIRITQGRLILNLRPFARSQIKPFVAGGVAAIPVIVVQQSLAAGLGWSAIPAAGTYLFIYGLLLRWMGLADEDRELVRSIRSKLPGWAGS